MLCQLGSFFDSYCNNHAEIKYNKFSKKFDLVINDAISSNPYFEKQNIHYNLKYWAKILKENVLESFSSKIFENKKIKSIGIIMAGNIPLVGFHDFLCVFLSGNKSDIKLSKKDSHLFTFVYSFLNEHNNDVKKYIEINDSILQDYDAVIATGNDLSANQFKKYFDKVPNIIRNSRFSVGLLNGDESDKDLKKLSFDIFMYYGLGCRSVSKLYLPKGYDINLIINSLVDWKEVINNNTYYNNYTYNKTIYLMKGERFFDT